MLIIGIAGGSGSGKTFFLNKLIQSLSSELVCNLSLDNYYKPKNEQEKDSNGIENFDLPTAFNIKTLLNDIQLLKSGTSVQFEKYNYNNADLSTEFETIYPAPILILEGIFMLYYEELIPFFDLKLFIEAPLELKIDRRIKRDKLERGYEKEDVLYRYYEHAIPSYEKYILPSKLNADLIIPNHQQVEKAVETITNWCKQKLMT